MACPCKTGSVNIFSAPDRTKSESEVYSNNDVWVLCHVYTVFKVGGPALFQSARIDGADFLNFDAPRGRDIHPPYLYMPNNEDICISIWCRVYHFLMQADSSGNEQHRGYGIYYNYICIL